MRTAEFPQADRLHQVGRVAEAVNAGLLHDYEIESYLELDSASRQGRYYRKAAELLGLVKTRGNVSELTDTGREFAQLAAEQDRVDFLGRCLGELELFRVVSQFIADENPTAVELDNYIAGLYPGALSTGRRRTSSVVAYIRDAGLATFHNDRYEPATGAGSAIIRYADLLPVPSAAKNARRPIAAVAEPKQSSYTIEIDAAKLERANLTHYRLVAGKSLFLKSLGLPAVETPLIDLWSQTADAQVIYEMKSLSGVNFVSQIRRAVAQLYEYRYAYKRPEARLCVVTNGQPDPSVDWYIDYLEMDRQIAYVWTADCSEFRCRKESKALLADFAP
jgi:hypothetical protein